MASEKQNTTGLEIAIIGMEGSFPNANNVTTFWEKIRNGEELIRFDIDDIIESNQLSPETFQADNYISAHGTLAEKDCFDAAFFQYLPAEARLMDPQIRVFHEVVWKALEDAGVQINKQNNIGLYAGASDNLLWKSYHTFLKRDSMVDPFLADLLCDKDRLSTLISYKLNLRGPSLTIRTACSTSLVAVHMACRALLIGECSIAVAGGVSIASNLVPGYEYRENMIYSSDGHTRTFDRDSDGTIFSDGAGAVVLKRLEQARKDKDHIYAVIKGSSINNDGIQKIGYTAPSIVGQTECIKMAHKVSRVAPESITYLEGHGTGTTLGDPVEIEALNDAFDNRTDKFCYIGSVKSNMGHLGAAAGIAGLIKVALALKHQEIPPSINFKNPNPKIPFEKGPFTVVDQLKPWPQSDSFPRRAGVSSFGIGGTNVHMIVEEALPAVATPGEAGIFIFPFSAKSKTSLKTYLLQFKHFWENSEAINLADVAFTLQRARTDFDFRKTLVATSKKELIDQLSKAAENSDRIQAVPTQARKLVFMFPGQGVQYAKMGYDLYLSEPVFREEMDKGFEKLKALINIDFKAVLLQKSEDAEQLHTAQYTQPILFVFQYALYQLLKSYGFTPDYLIGHSFGEYTSACISGVLSYEDTLKILLKRGEVVDQLPEGRMLGIATPADELKPYLSDQVSLASINSPEQCILSGEKRAIEDLMNVLDKDGVKYKLLKISFASHCAMVDLVLEEYKAFLQQFTFHAPQIPFISNYTGKLVIGEEGRSAQYWCDHLRNTVDFSSGIKTLDAQNDLVFVEIGPGDSLSRLFKQNKATKSLNKVVNLVKSGNEETTLNDQQYLCEAIAKLWEYKVVMPWDGMDKPRVGRKISLPTYAFKRDKYPVSINVDAIFNSMGNSINLQEINTIADAFPRDAELDPGELSESEMLLELKEIWKAFFGLEEVDPYADFFEFGGNSLKAMAMLKILNERYQINIPIKLFFKRSALADLTIEIQNLLWMNTDKVYKNKLKI